MPTIECRILQVEQDVSSGWFTIVTDQGKLSTKIRENADEALSLQGRQVLLDYDEQVKTKPAPDGSGMRTYRNRYYNRATESGNGGAASGFVTTGAPQPQPQAQAQPQPQIVQTEGRRTPPEDAWRMCLGVGAKCAVDTLPLMPNEQRTFEIQKEIALAWARFLFFTRLPDQVPINPPPTPEEAYRPPAFAGIDPVPSYEQPPPHGDDDIPF